ncbi:hypothetical protein PG987_005233 [Apiospora arundinis]
MPPALQVLCMVLAQWVKVPPALPVEAVRQVETLVYVAAGVRYGFVWVWDWKSLVGGWVGSGLHDY